VPENVMSVPVNTVALEKLSLGGGVWARHANAEKKVNSVTTNEFRLFLPMLKILVCLL
jgi:hypothetical protein